MGLPNIVRVSPSVKHLILVLPYRRKNGPVRGHFRQRRES